MDSTIQRMIERHGFEPGEVVEMAAKDYEAAVQLIAARAALNDAARANHNAQSPVFDMARDEAECTAAEAALGEKQGSYGDAMLRLGTVDMLVVLKVGHEQAQILDRGQGFVADGLSDYAGRHGGCDAVWAAAMGVARDLRAKGA